MRGATAKALRRLARKATEGAPYQAYVSRQHQKTGETIVIENAQRVKKKVKITTTELRLDPHSTKGYYRTLKREQKAGRFDAHAHEAEQARIEQERK